MKTLILYSSRDGHTRKIAYFIAKNINQSDLCEIKDLHNNLNINLHKYQRIVIGASIRYGYFSIKFYKFIKNKMNDLNTIPSAFYCVNLIARYSRYCTPDTNLYTKKFLKSTSWNPKISAVFAGALQYSKYNIYIKILMYFFMKIIKNKISLKDYIEFTNWNQVKKFSGYISKL
ncbi:MAG: menaquinone-dependent protoporphyrinogen IX dehydrogenase [Wigglesworthia glossinidia]|nr:menaquinone-dependent protoporphyrinogen IX dehydrogenase [Wigglesworthia glossinidia]